MTPAETLDKMVEQIVKRFRPWRIVLFGSYARGEAQAGSDLDLLIIAPSDEPRWRRTVPVYRLLAGFGVPKDIVWWTPEEVAEWGGVKAHFINTALREGKTLYEKPS
ncbi:MAG: nucleotidyltransferase domain-containing protein [Anaerolineae bacterium]